MNAYFGRVIDEKLALSEPLFFYHHPKDRHHDVLETVFSRSVDAGAHVVTMGSYASWWNGRRSEGMHVELRDGVISVDQTLAPKGYHLRIVGRDGKAAIVATDSAIHLDSVVWKWLPKPYAYPSDVMRVKAFNPRIPITLAVDALFAFRKKT